MNAVASELAELLPRPHDNASHLRLLQILQDLAGDERGSAECRPAVLQALSHFHPHVVDRALAVVEQSPAVFQSDLAALFPVLLKGLSLSECMFTCCGWNSFTDRGRALITGAHAALTALDTTPDLSATLRALETALVSGSLSGEAAAETLSALFWLNEAVPGRDETAIAPTLSKYPRLSKAWKSQPHPYATQG